MNTKGMKTDFDLDIQESCKYACWCKQETKFWDLLQLVDEWGDGIIPTKLYTQVDKQKFEYVKGSWVGYWASRGTYNKLYCIFSANVCLYAIWIKILSDCNANLYERYKLTIILENSISSKSQLRDPMNVLFSKKQTL